MGFHLSIHRHNLHNTHTFGCPIMGRSEILVMQHLSKSNNEEREIHLHKIYLFSISPCFHPNLTIEKLYFFNPEMNFSFSSNLKGGLVYEFLLASLKNLRHFRKWKVVVRLDFGIPTENLIYAFTFVWLRQDDRSSRNNNVCPAQVCFIAVTVKLYLSRSEITQRAYRKHSESTHRVLRVLRELS